MTTPSLPAHKLVCLGVLFVATAIAVWALLNDSGSWPHRYYARYVASLDAKLAALFLPARGRWVALGQVLLLEAIALVCIWVGAPGLYLAIPVAIVLPTVWLERRRSRRVRQIDAQVDGFMLTLANCLRVTPSLGSALSQAERLLQKPMNQELGLALSELRVGSSIEQALLDWGRRVQSAALDSALLALLIGRQIGGDLVKVLETTAATLREMARLRGVLRAKTAQSKAQMWVLALFPGLILVAFDAAQPGYFKPLLASPTGWVMIGVAAALWVASLLIARRVLSVKL
jgi:tight adherence protein B